MGGRGAGNVSCVVPPLATKKEKQFHQEEPMHSTLIKRILVQLFYFTKIVIISWIYLPQKLHSFLVSFSARFHIFCFCLHVEHLILITSYTTTA